MDGAQRARATEAMIRLADGDRSAFRPVFDLLWPALSTYAHRLLGDEALAEDAAQRALLKVFEQAAGFDPAGDALTWALAITTWECRSARRRAQRKRETPLEGGDLARIPDRLADPEAAALTSDLVAALEAVIDGLNDRDREAIRLELRRAGGEEPAGPALRKRKQRAMARLRAAWRAIHGDT